MDDLILPLLRTVYENLTNDGTTINLLLTEQCNFECDHCFYGAGMHKPRGYMSNEMLWKVRTLVHILRDLSIQVSINLIGGEPTLNLKEFKRCFDYAADWLWEPGPINLEMTTNGWWLHRASTATKFLEIVASAVRQAPGGIEDGFSVRISNDGYHQDFRKGKNIQHLYDELVENGSIDDEPVIFKEIWYCKCGHQFVTKNPQRCPECGEKEDFYTESEELLYMPPKEHDEYWLYVDGKGAHDYAGTIPSGERGQFGDNVQTCGGGELYSLADKLSFLPTGKHTDGCCKGSLMPFGTIDDHPLVLLALNYQFTVECEPSCPTCRAEARRWAAERLPVLKPQLIEALPKFLESLQMVAEGECDAEVQVG